MACAREKVLASKVVAKHGEELAFLRWLQVKLKKPTTTVRDVAEDVSKRIAALEAGAETAFSQQQEPVLALPLVEIPSLNSEKTPEYAAAITLESLVWGRHYGGWYPHRSCSCSRHRSSAEMISIRSDSSLSLATIPTCHSPALISSADAAKLVRFHITHLAWHHGILHTPTFLEQCETFWSTNTYRHPLWMALYYAVLSCTTWSIQNSPRLKSEVGIIVAENDPRRYFEAMVDTLYSEKFLETASMYSVQAITLSTEVAHNLGFSDLNASLVAAAIRLAQCMGLHKITESLQSQADGIDQWYEKIERETGKRVWCQLVLQDHSGVCFTDSYSINPKHCLTELPKNCDDHDLEERDQGVPTITSYIRTIALIADLVPKLFTELGPLWSRKPVREQYRDVLKGDQDMRQLIGDIPSFLLREDVSDNRIDQPWLDIARRSLAITAAEKIILIHRPFLFPSFKTARYPHTRATCVSAATTITREYANIVAAEHVSLWEHSAYCVTASIILCLELLFPRSAADANKNTQNSTNYYDLVGSTRNRLASRQGDVIAARGVRLIDAMLSVGGFPGVYTSPSAALLRDAPGVSIDPEDIVARFLGTDAASSGEAWQPTLYPTSLTGSDFPLDMDLDLDLDVDLAGLDFDSWFDGLFRAQIG